MRAPQAREFKSQKLTSGTPLPGNLLIACMRRMIGRFQKHELHRGRQLPCKTAPQKFFGAKLPEIAK